MKNLFCLTFLLSALIVKSQTNDLKPIDYFTQSEIDKANTAKDVEYLTSEEKDIYLYTNLVRLFPQKFHKMYVAFVYADGKESFLNSNSYYTTLSEDLKKREPLVAVFPNEQMFKLAECWAIESGKKGLTGHDRKDCEKGQDGENCAYGLSTGLSIVMQLLIDYGIPNLGHRKNLLHPEWVGMGAAIRPHSEFRIGAVQDFSRTNDLIKESEEKRDLLIEKRWEELTQIMALWDQDELKASDINRKAKYLNDFEKDFYLYINLMSVNPKKFKEAIWDKGPFFDQLPTELEEGVKTTDQYRAVSKWLESANAKEIRMPDKKRIEELKCVIEKFKTNNSSYRSCFTSPGAWQFASYLSESNFNDIMNILLTPEDFDRIFKKNATVALENDGEIGIKVFLMEN